MKVFIVKSGKKLQGRLLAHDEAHALKQAAEFWGREKKYKAEEYKKESGR